MVEDKKVEQKSQATIQKNDQLQFIIDRNKLIDEIKKVITSTIKIILDLQNKSATHKYEKEIQEIQHIFEQLKLICFLDQKENQEIQQEYLIFIVQFLENILFIIKDLEKKCEDAFKKNEEMAAVTCTRPSFLKLKPKLSYNLIVDKNIDYLKAIFSFLSSFDLNEIKHEKDHGNLKIKCKNVLLSCIYYSLKSSKSSITFKTPFSELNKEKPQSQIDKQKVKNQLESFFNKFLQCDDKDVVNQLKVIFELFDNNEIITNETKDNKQKSIYLLMLIDYGREKIITNTLDPQFEITKGIIKLDEELEKLIYYLNNNSKKRIEKETLEEMPKISKEMI